MTDLTEEEIINRLRAIGSALGFKCSDNIDKIARLKARMDDWRDCPCDKENPMRYCGSKLCEYNTISDDKCHCGLFVRG